MTAATHLVDDLEELRALLRSNVERLAEALLGEPNKALSTKRALRFGGKGSLVVELRGRKRGEWFSHEAGTGGGPFELIRFARDDNFLKAVQWAKSWSGTAERLVPAKLSAPVHSQKDTAEADRQTRAAIATARAMAHAAVPIAGTLAEAYLVGPRGIPTPEAGWPDAIRFHAGTRSLLAVATQADGAVQAVQRVHLTPAAQKLSPEEVKAGGYKDVKTTNGRHKGAVVRLALRQDVTPALATLYC